MVLDLDWDRPLQHRRGSPNRLEGIDLYYDFDWEEVFADGRAQFRNGKSLAHLVRAECPGGKTPALLLTVRDDVHERTEETETHFVVILNLRHYLDVATADAAASYFARGLGQGITRIAQLHELASRPELIEAVLDISHIGAWAAENPDRIEQLRRIVGEFAGGQHVADLPSALAALRALESLDAEVVAALEDALRLRMDRETRLQFLRILTSDQPGRHSAGEVLGERLHDRLEDARQATQEYRHLLEDPSSTETALQRFIEGHPWLLGLDYARVHARRLLPRGQMDFMLERYDGFHDLLELKSPGDSIVTAPPAVGGMPPSAASFSLSSDLAQALAQVHVYRDTLTDTRTIEERYGLRNARDPMVIIVIGQARGMPQHCLSVLRELNLSLHRVQVVPYDILADRADTMLDNVERYLSSASVSTPFGEASSTAQASS